MFPRTLTHSIILLLLASGAAVAQPVTGLPPFGSFSGGPFDTIDNANLNVYFQIPIISKAGRGLPFTYSLVYNNSIWAPVTTGGTTAWTPTTVSNWGWGNVNEAPQSVSGYLTYHVTQYGCPFPVYPVQVWHYWNYYNNFSYVDPLGVTHPLPQGMAVDDWASRGYQCGGGNSTMSGTTTDSSGITVTAQSYYNGVYASSAVTSDGTSVTLPLGLSGPATRQDTNGNQITAAYNNGVATITDTLNTTALTASGSNPLTLSYTNPQGASSHYSVNFGSRTVQTAFGCAGVAEYGPLAANLVTGIDLPDGSSYAFVYETTPGDNHNPHYVTGRIASITLPAGGTISYAYSGGSNGIACSNGTTPTLGRTTPDGAWTYVQSGNTTTITDPQTPTHNQTRLMFQGLYEVQRKVYQGSIGSGTLLRTVDTCYNGAASPCTTTPITAYLYEISAITTLPGGAGLQSKTEAYYDIYGQPYLIQEYDYGTGTVGGLVRKTVFENYLYGKPSMVAVKDPNDVVVAQTNYTFDEGTPATTTNTPQHVSVTNPRGNITTITTQTSGSTSLTKHFTYFDTGNVQTATDVNGAVTTYTYGACGNSFVTGTTVTGTGLPTNPALSTSATWDTYCYGAVPLTATDANGQTTTTYYNGNNNTIWRPTSVVDPTNATTSLTYTRYTDSTHPAYVESALNFATSSTVDNLSAVDGLGRVHISQRKQSQTSSNYDSVETDYDFAGRPSKVTVPYQAAARGTSTGSGTTTIYDALNRPKEVDDAGGGWTKFTYAQNNVLVEIGPQVTLPAPENTKKRQFQYDALGRLTSVCEITEAAGSGTCGPAGSPTGYWTTYTYNLLDKLTGVTQNAQGTSQSRSYQYDRLGRMTQEQNPESGTFTYSYDSDTACGTYSGDLVKRSDAVGNVTCYQYDGLHRVTAALPQTGSPYYSRTPQKHYVYDQSPALGSMGRLGHAYTCPASPSDCSTWTTDLGFVYSSRGELSDVYELTPNSNGYYHLSATYWANGLINTLNSRLGSLPTWTYNPEGEGRASTVSDSSPRTLVSPTSYNLYGLPTNITFGSTDYDTFQYDAATGRMTQFASIVRSASLTGTPTWNPNGSLRQLAIVDGFNNPGSAQTCTYQHDDLARIAAVNCGT